MSSPPPLPHASPEPPPPIRAESLWEFHADERVLDASFGLDGRIRVVDALGTMTTLDAQGRVVLTSRADVPLRAAAIQPAGGALLLGEDEWLRAVESDGSERFQLKLAGAISVGCGGRSFVVGSERHPLRLFSPAGKLRAECNVEHAAAFVAPCSAEGHAVALAISGQFSVVSGSSLLWRLHLRSTATALAGSESGTFVIAHRDGAQAFTIDGMCLGLFDTGRPLRGVALAHEAPVLVLLDESDTLHLADLRTGFSTWRESRPREQAGVRLSRDGSRALAIARAGGVELLAFRSTADRAGRLEVLGKRAAEGDGVWRHVTAIIPNVEPSARVAIDATGSTIAVSRDEGARIEVFDASAARVAAFPATRDLAALSFSTDGSRLLLHGQRGVTTCARDGSSRTEISGSFSHAIAGDSDALLLATAAPPGVRACHGRDVLGETTLPGAPVHVLCSADLGRVAIADASNALTGWAAGCRPWRRRHEARAGSLVMGGPGLIASEGPEIVGLHPDGTQAWRVASPGRVELLTLGDAVFLREASNRFARVHDDGRLEVADARPNLGRSILMTWGTLGLLELNVNARTLTAFYPDGRIAWRCEAPEPVAPISVLSRPGLLAFRAGSRLCLLSCPDATPASEAAARTAFLEL